MWIGFMWIFSWYHHASKENVAVLAHLFSEHKHKLFTLKRHNRLAKWSRESSCSELWKSKKRCNSRLFFFKNTAITLRLHLLRKLFYTLERFSDMMYYIHRRKYTWIKMSTSKNWCSNIANFVLAFLFQTSHNLRLSLTFVAGQHLVYS